MKMDVRDRIGELIKSNDELQTAKVEGMEIEKNSSDIVSTTRRRE